MPDRTVEALERTGALMRGHFVLSSGKHSDSYCQCARLFEQPSEAAGLAAAMATTLHANGVEPEAVVAPALGGVLWGYELARALGVRSVFAERADDGAFALRRGFSIQPNEAVLLAEDVVTTGGSIMEVAGLVERLGGRVAGFATVVDRSGGAFTPGPPFHTLARLDLEAHDPGSCPLCAHGAPAVKPGSRPAPVVAVAGAPHDAEGAGP